MGRKTKYTVEQKLRAVEDVLIHHKSKTSVCKSLHKNLALNKLNYWIAQYKAAGVVGLKTDSKNNSYSNDDKMLAVQFVKDGHSVVETSRTFLIPDSIIRGWLKCYNSPKGRNIHMGNKGGKSIKKQYFDIDTMEKAVKECIESGYDYKGVASKYTIKYGALYTWVKKYEAYGIEGLKRKHTDPKSSKNAVLSETDKLKEENAKKDRRIKELEETIEILKKRRDIIQIGYRTDKIRQLAQYLAIKELSDKYDVFRLCNELDVSRASYYKWKNRKKSKTEERNIDIDEKIVYLFNEFDEIYGYRRIRNELKTQFDISVSSKYVLHRMQSLQIKSRIRRKRYLYKPCQKIEVYENILNRHFKADEKNTIWETDVTEFHLPDGKKLYLSAIMDRYDHSIVSYNISNHNDQQLTLDDLRNAINLNPGSKPFLHSDRGATYTTTAYNDLLREYGLTHSMSRVGKCIDNGPMEGFWGTLKSEAYYGKKIKTFEEMKLAIDSYMVFYNTKRRQESLSHKTPYEYRLSGPVLQSSSFN